MRMVKMKPKPMDLETAMQKFLPVRESQRTGEETMKNCRSGRSSCQDTAKKRIFF